MHGAVKKGCQRTAVQAASQRVQIGTKFVALQGTPAE